MAKGFFSRKTSVLEDGLEVWRQRERYRGLTIGAKRNLQSAWDKVISGRSGGTSLGNQLHITLDLAAPKIIIPQNILDEDSGQILIDFGRLKFSNVNEDNNGDDDDDEFFTPGDSPANEEFDQKIFETKLDADELQERLMVSKLYNKYSINLLDLQILVGNNNDAWRAASSAGKSSMHIVERFNVSLGLERRALDMVADTKYPFAMLSGILPSLTVHLNETKCATLWGCLKQLNSEDSKSSSHMHAEDEDLKVELSIAKPKRASKLVYMMFQIERVTVGLASEIHHNQTIAALEISQVKSEIKVSSSHQSCIFSISSVVLADCYQQLGPDFEFILASNSGMYLDIPSGTIIDSGATSPTFEAMEAHKMPESPNFVSKLTENLLGLLTSVDPSDDKSEMSSWSNPKNEMAVVEWTHWNNPDTDIRDDISIRFSALNIVASPPSIAVLLRLLYRLKPKSKEVVHQVDVRNQDIAPPPGDDTVINIEVSTVNVMIASVDNTVGKKIASAGIENFKSTAILQKTGDAAVQGKIGSIHLLDLENEDTNSTNRIFALGDSRVPDIVFATIFSRQHNDDAFNFEFRKCSFINVAK